MSQLPSGLERLFTEIDFINLTRDKQKICFSTKTTVDSSSVWGAIYRWWYEESHDRMIHRIRELICTCAEAIDNTEWNQYRPNVFYRLIRLDNTLEGQMTVYDTNNDAISRLAVAREKIDEQLKKMRPDEHELVEKLRKKGKINTTLFISSVTTEYSEDKTCETCEESEQTGDKCKEKSK